MACSSVGKAGERGSKCACAMCVHRQLIVHMQRKREKKGWKGGIENRVKERGEMKNKRDEMKGRCRYFYL